MKLSIKQTIAFDYLNDNVTNEEVYGGGAGGGKSALGCIWILQSSLEYKETKSLIGRAVLKTLKETTLQTLFEVCKMFGMVKDKHYNFNAQSNIIELNNGSSIILKDLATYPSDPNFDELGSLEITRAFIDEANQISAKAKNIVKSRIRYNLDNNGLIPKILYTCNPAKNWVYNEFYKPFKEGKLPENKKFIQSLVTDNPFISKHYIENLKTLDNESKQRLLLGNWEYDNDPTKLIKYEKIIDLFTNDFIKKSNQKYLTVDAARYGSDKAVIIYWNGFIIEKIHSYAKSSMEFLKNEIDKLRIEFQIPMSNIIVDDDGVGGGLVDILHCKGFVNNSKPLFARKNTNYANLKTQCFFELADHINNNKIFINAPISIETKETIIEDLETIKKDKIDNDNKLHILSKDKVRELIGRSPDFADAIMMRMYFVLKAEIAAY